MTEKKPHESAGKWDFVVHALMLVLLIMLGLYCFDDVLGFSGIIGTLSDSAKQAIHNRQTAAWPEPDWQLAMLLGIVIGSLAGSLISGSWKLKLTFEELTSSFFKRGFVTIFCGFLAGFLMMIGFLLAGETFFGQLAAAMELSSASWIFLIVFFAVGSITALFRTQRKESGSDTEPNGNAGDDK